MAFKSFAKTVAAAGTRERLVAIPTAASAFVIQAKEANTGVIYLGDATVTSSTVSGLSPGSTLSFGSDFPLSRSIDLSDIYLDAAVSAEGVNVYYISSR